MVSFRSLKSSRGYLKISLLLIIVFGLVLCAGHKSKVDRTVLRGPPEELARSYHGRVPDGSPEQCPFYKYLDLTKTTGGDKEDTKSTFGFLFPENPLWSSFLATAYISLVPNFILIFVSPSIRPNTLNLLVSFAVGSLLGDVFLHLLPEAFSGEATGHHGESMHWHNLYVGLGVFGGFAFFFLLDKSMRLMGGVGGHSHSHPHSHSHSHLVDSPNLADKELRERKKNDITVKDTKLNESKETSSKVLLSAYLNLIADITHNFTDGLAVAASFYASKAIGISTFVAVFCHEIPHEVGDYAILVQSGFSKGRALSAQFVTAIGAFLGTLLGVVIEEAARNPERFPILEGILGGHSHSIVTAGELILPVTAGGFIYIATVGVIPELLEGSSQGTLQKDLYHTVCQIAAMVTGVGVMVAITILEEM